MTIPVFVEPTADGFRASTGAPLDLTAEAATEAAALDAVRARVAEKLAAGGRVVSLPVGSGGVSPTDTLETIAARLAANPLIHEFHRATAEARRQMEAEDEAREREWAAEHGRSTADGTGEGGRP